MVVNLETKEAAFFSDGLTPCVKVVEKGAPAYEGMTES